MYIKLEDAEKYLLQICTPESALMIGLKSLPTINPVEVLEELIGYYKAQEKRSNDDGDRGAVLALEEAIEKLKS